MKYFIHRIAGFPGQHTSSPGCYDYVDGYQLMQEGSIELTESDYNPEGYVGYSMTDEDLISAFEGTVEGLQAEMPDTSYALIKVDNDSKVFIEWV